MVWFGVPREMLVLFDFGPRETYFPQKLAYASRGGTTALEAYQRLSRAEIPRETLKTMTWLYKDALTLMITDATSVYRSSAANIYSYIAEFIWEEIC